MHLTVHISCDFSQCFLNVLLTTVKEFMRDLKDKITKLSLLFVTLLSLFTQTYINSLLKY